MPDYQKELEKYPDAPLADRQELEKLAVLQKDIAIGGSAEDFVRHPFFRAFQDEMNRMISDAKGEMAALLDKPGVTIADMQALKAGTQKIVELKAWINKKVMAGRIAQKSIADYEAETEDMNAKIQEAIDKSNIVTE